MIPKNSLDLPILAPYEYDPDFDVSVIKRKNPSIYKNDLLGPHEERIYELFLMGKKGVAILNLNDKTYQQFRPFIKKGLLKQLVLQEPRRDVIVYRPELEADAIFIQNFLQENSRLIKSNTHRSDNESAIIHRHVGEILGYPKKCIDFFCEKYERKSSIINKFKKILKN